MSIKTGTDNIKFRLLVTSLIITLMINCIASCDNHPAPADGSATRGESVRPAIVSEEYNPVCAILILPENPAPGEPFRILSTGGQFISKARLDVTGPTGIIKSIKKKAGNELPYWRIDDYEGCSAGKFKVTLTEDSKLINDLEFSIGTKISAPATGKVWKTVRGWDSSTEVLYSVWINALFGGYDETASWPALHNVIQDKEHNFLYNYLSLGEDDPDAKNRLIMQPDCADNPFFLRAYFAWKLGLPFGFHICDRGSLEHNPATGQWITNETFSSKSTAVQAFNDFLRRVMNGVHSGTARTALDNENSDYYPLPLERTALRPGSVYADPYGHTLIIVSWISQTSKQPGLLLAIDAQPDGTVGIKRFWKGNFLFNTSGVIGEPGFKAFRPIKLNKGAPVLLKNNDLNSSAGFVPFSLKQRKMKPYVFYHTMERLINPNPLDPETEMLDLIQALYEQLLVRVTSVANGEAYLKSHPGTVIPMPSGASAIFVAGGMWENFSTPNRDLRLLIAMDAVLGFPDLVSRSPQDFNISGTTTPEQVKEKLQSILDRKGSELKITYTRTDGSLQSLTLNEILKRRDAFEMTFNPNDGIEIRWGAPENSDEMATCRRHAPPSQIETMRKVRPWFNKRLHPPT
jgi:hypothetical protein